MHAIANRWYAVLSSRELGKRPVAARRFDRPLVFWRTGRGTVAATLDECPHRRAKLSPGRVIDGCIECPFHGFRFDAHGACTLIPAHPERAIPKAMAVHALEVREAYGLVWLWSGPDPAPEDPIPFFDLDQYSCSGSEFTVPVDTHYTRAIENQLDFTHLPFVHRTTIGRSLSPEMDVVVEVDGDRIIAHLRDQPGRLEFLGPNVWRLQTGPVWQFLAFVPIDETHMQYYVRMYQRVTRIPGLAWLVGAFSRVSSRFILRQDTAVVESQPDGETKLRAGEILVPSDEPIIAYRRWREAHRVEFLPHRTATVSIPSRSADQS